MMLVRMLFDLQGARHDGKKWPGYKGLLDVSDEEARGLIADGIAESAEDPELDRGYDVLRAPSADYEKDLKRLDGESRDDSELFHADGRRDPHATGLVDEDEDGDAQDDDDDFDRNDAPEVPVPSEVKKPYGNAKKDEWIAYAVSQGARRSDISEMTKAMLVDLYG